MINISQSTALGVAMSTLEGKGIVTTRIITVSDLINAPL